MKKSLVSIMALAVSAMVTMTACSSGDGTPTSTPSVKPNETSTPTVVPSKYSQSSFFDGKDFPPIEQRLPSEPKLVNEMDKKALPNYEIGKFGGTLRTVTSSIDWNADIFLGCTEALLNMPGLVGDEITANVVKSYEANEDATIFTFHLREGLKWSDGEPVTMDDFRFTYENFLKNKTLVPVVPSWMCSGGSADGTPMVMNFLDESAFTITFDQPYGGFLIHLAASGWKGYTEMLKPSHYLKPYHTDMPEYDEKKVIEVADRLGIGHDEQMWANVFNQVDITNWELTQKVGIGFPKLYPWILDKTDDSGQTYTYVRNPYYFKVDSSGQQLPYIDEISDSTVSDMEMVTMQSVSGEVDFAREPCNLNNMTLYKENEKNGFMTLMSDNAGDPAAAFLNLTYDDETWRLVTQDVRFRRAMNYAINRDEIVDALFFGLSDPTGLVDVEFNVDKANALLDEMGMDKKDKGGNRLAPNGKPFEILIEVGAESSLIVPSAELLTEMWNKVNVKTIMKRAESSLIGNKQNSNQLQSRIMWHEADRWWGQDWGLAHWGFNWNIWRSKTTEATITNEDGSTSTVKTKGEEPPSDVKEFYELYENLMVVPSEDVQSVYTKMKDSMKENVWYFPFTSNSKVPVIFNAKIGNTTENTNAHAINLALEILYYK